MVRQFKLINALGQEFDLMRKDAFFQTPSGLGFSVDFDVEPVGYDWIETDSQIDQKTVSGELVFTKYQGYQEFIRFCSLSPLCAIARWIPGIISPASWERSTRGSSSEPRAVLSAQWILSVLDYGMRASR